MENIVIKRTWRQGAMLAIDNLFGTAFTGEVGAHTFEISGVNDAGTVALSGNVTGTLLAANNVNVPLTGSIQDGCAVVTLTDECYEVPGRFVLSIYTTEGGKTMCVYCGVGTITNTEGDAVAYPSAAIPDIQQLINDLQTLIGQIPADYSALNQSVTDLKSATEESQEIGYFTNPTGGYINGAYNSGSVRRTKIYIVPNEAVKMHYIGTSDAYWDVYGFFDSTDTVISGSYVREGSTAKSYDIDIAIPSGAKKFYICSSAANLENAVVSAIMSKPDIAIDGYASKTLKPFRVLRSAGLFTASQIIEYANGYVALYYDMRGLSRVTLTTTLANYCDVYNLLDDDETILTSVHSAGAYPSTSFTATIDVTSASILLVTTTTANIDNITVVATNQPQAIPDSNLTQKQIVWYGTSIPAAGLDGSTHPESYPSLVGGILGANVANKAVGSSCVCCKDPALITTGNPYGFKNNFEAASRCLTNTVAEMEWIIEHYNDTSVFTYATVGSLSDDDKAFIKSCSYENRLLPYLASNTLPDLFVFDHGHNDGITEAQEGLYEQTLTGTVGTGFYQNGSFSASSYEQHKIFDVSGYKTCYISGEIAGYVDAYTLFDSSDNVIGKYYNNGSAAITLDNYPVDVSAADHMAVSTSRLALPNVTVTGKLIKNLYCYRGAMDFLFETILNFSPKTRIVMIGEYENEKRPLIAKYQKVVADDWEIPIYPQWAMYGWSQHTVTTNWWWDSNYWVRKSASHTLTLLDCALCDGIHPHTDASGQTLQYMAEHIAGWMQNNIITVW